jgi:hypothetical protein
MKGNALMRKSLMLATTALTAAFLLAASVGTASARNLSLSNQNFRIVWRELILGNGLVNCEVTLEGSFHYRTIVKRERALIGWITRGVARHPCRSGDMWFDNGTEEFLGRRTINGLPWHVTYETFLGALPNITGIRLLLRAASAPLNVAGLCLARYGLTEDNISLLATVVAGVIGTIRPVEGANTLTRREVFSGSFCPATVELRGEGVVTLLGNTTRLTVTLI